MTNLPFPARLAPAAAILILVLSGCAAPGAPGQPGAPAAGGASASASVPAVFTVGGNVTLRRAAPARHPRFPDLPAIESATEWQALETLVRTLYTRAHQGLVKNDADAFWAQYDAGQRLAAYAVDITLASNGVLRGMRDDGSGKIVSTLPAESMALLPISPAVGALPLGLPPASLGAQAAPAPVTINTLLGIAPRQPGQQPVTYTVNGLPSLRELPEDQPVALPNGVVATRKGEILVLVNPTRQAQPLPLSDIGYVLPGGAAATVQDWTRIALAISQNKTNYFWNKIARLGAEQTTFRCDMARPGALECTDGDIKWFRPDGGWATTQADAEATAQAHAQPGSAWRRAMDQVVRGAAGYEPFHRGCTNNLGSGQAYADLDELSGAGANFVTFSCWRAERANGAAPQFYLLHSQQYRLAENGTRLQTEASLLNDARVRERLNGWQREKELMQSISALVPVAGQLDALARCAQNPDFAPTAFLADYLQRRKKSRTAVDLQAASLVGYQTPTNGVGGTVVDCGGVLVPMISGLMKGRAAAANAKSMLENWPRVRAAIDSAKRQASAALASDATALQAIRWAGKDGLLLSFKTGKMLGYLDWYAGEARAGRAPQAGPYQTVLKDLGQ
ncbi:hypothetical protein [Massilia brevitalea]|uniref:hypothetical protein n=1 Tax=Massilia brevitalea TaxID=442526 RepID=UPI002738813C|nr:hypothetical protein [Massilia brevitalea]